MSKFIKYNIDNQDLSSTRNIPIIFEMQAANIL